MGQRKGTYSAQVFRPVMKRGVLERTLVMLIYIPGVAAAFIIIIFFGCFPFQCVHSFDP